MYTLLLEYSQLRRIESQLSMNDKKATTIQEDRSSMEEQTWKKGEVRVFDSKRLERDASMPLARSFLPFFPDENEDYSG